MLSYITLSLSSLSVNGAYILHIIIDQVAALVRKIQKEIHLHLDISLSASISETAYNFYELRDKYIETLENSENRIKAGHMCVLLPASPSIEAEPIFTFPSNKAKSITDALKLSKNDQVISLFNDFIEYISHFAYNDIKFSLMYFFLTLYDTLNTIQINDSSFSTINFTYFNNEINSLETLDEMRTEFYKLFDTVFSRNIDDKSEVIVNAAIEIIHKTYTNTNLCSDAIAGSLKVSATYLRKLFRVQTNLSIQEYINDVRLKKATEFLHNSSMNVEEIIVKIGWENNKYFYNVFKKKFGVTPSEYRLNLLRVTANK